MDRLLTLLVFSLVSPGLLIHRIFFGEYKVHATYAPLLVLVSLVVWGLIFAGVMAWMV